MKSLKSYIYNIFEGSMLYNNILSRDEAKSFFKEYTKYNLTDDIIDQLYNIEGTKTFNDAFITTQDKKHVKLRRYIIPHLKDFTNINIKGDKISFNNGDSITIGNGKGDTPNADIHEGLTCYILNFIFNNINKIDVVNSDYIDSIVFDTEIYKLNDSWVKSCKKQALIIYNYLNTGNTKLHNYKAVLREDVKDPVMKQLKKSCEVFKSYGFSSVDSYNPADIYIYNKRGNISVTLGKNSSDFARIYECMLKLINNKTLIGFSLKKITKDEGNVSEFNIKDNISKNILDPIKNSKVSDIHVTDGGIYGYIEYTSNNDIYRESKFNFRSNRGDKETSAFTMEFTSKKSGGQEGKCKSYLNSIASKYGINFKYDEITQDKYNKCINNKLGIKVGKENIETINSSSRLMQQYNFIYLLTQLKDPAEELANMHLMAIKEHNLALPFIKVS